MIDQLLLATSNPHKIKEIKAIWQFFNPDNEIKFLTPTDLGISLKIEEVGETFFENAYLKAKAWAEESQLPTLADDSGLVVPILNGRPGIYSARWGKDDKERIQKLLSALAQIIQWKDRQAVFVCEMVFYYPQKEIVVKTRGELKGYISREPKGKGGFGYDPVMFLPTINKTVAQLSAEEKNQISHRSQALRQMIPLLIGRENFKV